MGVYSVILVYFRLAATLCFCSRDLSLCRGRVGGDRLRVERVVFLKWELVRDLSGHRRYG